MAEMSFDFFPGHRKTGSTVQDIIRIRGIARIRRRNTLKGIGDPDRPVFDAMIFEDRPHIDSRASAPDTGFDKVARYAILQDLFDTEPNVPKALSTDHGQAAGRQCPALLIETARVHETSRDSCRYGSDANGKEDSGYRTRRNAQHGKTLQQGGAESSTDKIIFEPIEKVAHRSSTPLTKRRCTSCTMHRLPFAPLVHPAGN
jgi:hypothetical protein